MPRTIGYHLVFSGYGLWLPGDSRGAWSEAWDAQIGFHEPHVLHPGDPVRPRIAQERMAHPPVRLDEEMIRAVESSLRDCEAQSEWRIFAASIEITHAHLLLTYTEREIDKTIKWLKDRTTKAVHESTRHRGPVWCKGHWCGFVFDVLAWRNAVAYVERHNERRGEGPRPYDFVTVEED